MDINYFLRYKYRSAPLV